MWEWVLQNKAWLFSGSGITALAIVWWAIRKLLSGHKAPAQNQGGQPQVGINASQSITPVFSSHRQTSPVSGDERQGEAQAGPDIKAVAFKSAFAQGIGTGKSCFIMSFRNDGCADATNVIAHIGYTGDSGQKMLVDYGGWVEHQVVMNIPRGYTKNLIIGVTDGGKNFAVTDIAPATNYTRFELVEVGEITPGGWKMVVTLGADNFRKDYPFRLTVSRDGSLLCNPASASQGQEKKMPKGMDVSLDANVCSLRPEVTTVSYDEELNVFEKRTGENAVRSALLPFSNEARAGKRTAPVGSLMARLTYYKRDGIDEFKRIDYGCWLGEEYRYASLGVGDIAYLVAALYGNGEAAVVRKTPRRSADGHSRDDTEPDSLPLGAYDLKVDLVGGDHGEYAETYWFHRRRRTARSEADKAAPCFHGVTGYYGQPPSPKPRRAPEPDFL